MRSYSLEITARDAKAVEQARDAVPAGTRIAVTALPGEPTEAGIAAAAAVARLGFTPVPHVAARAVASRAALDDLLARLRGEADVEELFLIAGDLPEPAGAFADALSIVRTGLLPRHGIRAVGVAGYPEGHPRIASADLRTALRDKHAVLGEQRIECAIVTQLCFDAEAMLRWIASTRQDGIDAPVRLGVAGPASARTLLRFAARCGVAASTRMLARYGMSVARLLAEATPAALLETLDERLDPSRHGAVDVHFYSFGGVARCAAWAAAWSKQGAMQWRDATS